MANEAPTAPRLFRVVFTGESSLRIMEKGGDSPATWRLPFDSGPVPLVAVSDLVVVEHGLPRHVGLKYVVEIEAETIDEAADAAKSWAETQAFMLASTRRAPIGPVWLELAYEITPGLEERRFRQWWWDPPIPIGKPVANAATFGELRDRLDELGNESPPSKLLWRVVLSMSWFRQALDDTDPMFRFLKLWIAAEALNPLLDEHYNIPSDERSGFQGLRRLADELGPGSELVTEVLGIRRALFHGLRITPDELRQRADGVVKDLEELCIAGWRLLVPLQEPFPAESVVPHRLQMQIDAVLVHRDESSWDVHTHPFLEMELVAEKVETDDPREVTFKLPTKGTVRNADGMRLLGQGLWGPTGYSPLKFEEDPGIDAAKNPDEPADEGSSDPPTAAAR